MSTEPVGSLTEEAAKLLAVLHGWASTTGTDQETDPHAHSSHHPDGSDCRWCPHCRLVRAAKATSPEVREHLMTAATSFGLAVQELLATPPEPAERTEGSGRTEGTQQPESTKGTEHSPHPVGARASDRDVPIEKIDLPED